MTFEDLRLMMKGVSKDIECNTQEFYNEVEVTLRSKKLKGAVVVRVQRCCYSHGFITSNKNYHRDLMNEICIEVLQMMLSSGWYQLCENHKIVIDNANKQSEKFWRNR